MANEANRPDDLRTTEPNSPEHVENNAARVRDNADAASAAAPESEAEIGELIEERAELLSDREVPLEASSEPVRGEPVSGEPVSNDPADAIPVPPAMSAAEIDERARAVEAVRGNVDPDADVTP